MKRKILIITTVLLMVASIIIPTYADSNIQQITINNPFDNDTNIDESPIVINNLSENVQSESDNSDDEDIDIYLNSIFGEESDDEQLEEEVFSYATMINPEYKIVIPKTIILDDNKQGNYKIEIIGDIPKNVAITIEPDEIVNFSSKNKPDKTGAVSQERLIFNSEDETECLGMVTAEDLDAGTWTGNFNFYISSNVFDSEHEHIYSATPLIRNKILPTCTEEGSYEEVYYCTACGKDLETIQYIISENGHTESAILNENIKLSSCTEEGFHDEVCYCQDCGIELFRKTITDPIIAHDFDNGIILAEPTDTKSGKIMYTCLECGKTIEEDIPAKVANVP